MTPKCGIGAVILHSVGDANEEAARVGIASSGARLQRQPAGARGRRRRDRIIRVTRRVCARDRRRLRRGARDSDTSAPACHVAAQIFYQRENMHLHRREMMTCR